jgi:hypothetical protein
VNRFVINNQSDFLIMRSHKHRLSLGTLIRLCPRCKREIGEANYRVKQSVADSTKVMICECGYFERQ